MVRDTGFEVLISTTAGQTGDALEAQGNLIDVAPPIDTLFQEELKAGEQCDACRLEGANQPLELLVIARFNSQT